MRKQGVLVGVVLSGFALTACAHEPAPAVQAARQQESSPLGAPGENGDVARARHAATWSRGGFWTRQELGPDYTPAGSGAVPTRRDARAWRAEQQARADRANSTVR